MELVIEMTLDGPTDFFTIRRSLTAQGVVTKDDTKEIADIFELAYDQAIAYVALRDAGTTGTEPTP